MLVMLSVSMAKASAYVIGMISHLDAVNLLHPRESWEGQHKSGLRKIINRYGLRVSP